MTMGDVRGVFCDYCGKQIGALDPKAIRVTLRGPEVRHKKADVCDPLCFAAWAFQFQEAVLTEETQT